MPREADNALALALSPLLPPLRFLSRAGIDRLPSLKDVEPLVEKAVADARPHAPAALLEALAESARGFDAAAEVERRAALARIVVALAALVEIPAELKGLAETGGAMSDPPGKMGFMKQDTLFSSAQRERPQARETAPPISKPSAAGSPPRGATGQSDLLPKPPPRAVTGQSELLSGPPPRALTGQSELLPGPPPRG